MESGGYLEQARKTVCAAAILLGLLCPPDAHSQGKQVYRISLEDSIINPVSAEYVTTSIDKAEKEGAACLIIEMDTPGGLLSSTRTIVKEIMNSSVPVVVYVAPKGARAGSAGVFITLAADVSAMAPSTNIGAAHPVELSEKRSTSEAIEELIKKLTDKKKDEGRRTKKPHDARRQEPMDQKVLNDTKAWVSAIARDRGRNVGWALKAVEESVSATETEAKRLGVIDIIASDMEDLIAKLDGRSVKLKDRTVTLRTRGAPIIDIEKNFRLRWLAVLAHPNIAYILLMLGFYGLVFEFTHPGIGFPGIAGAVCLILAFFGLQVIPTNYAGMALIVLAIVLFIAEVKVTSYGLLTLGGVATLFLGSLILFASPYEFMRVSLPIVLAFTLATLMIAIFLIFVVVRAQKRRPVTGAEGLVGAKGEVRAWSGGRGKVFVHGELWDARSAEELAVGADIDVVSVEGMTLDIKKHAVSSKR